MDRLSNLVLRTGDFGEAWNGRVNGSYFVKTSAKESNLLEKLADLEHEQWMKWAKDLMTKEDLSTDRTERWEKECFMPYDKLSEEMKEEDRKWARKVLNIVNENKDMNKEAIKKTAVEPVNPLEGDDALSGIDDAGDEGLGGGDLGGDLGGGLGGGLDGGLGGGLDEVAEGMGNDYYDALKVTRTPDLERQIQHDDMDDLDYSQLV